MVGSGGRIEAMKYGDGSMDAVDVIDNHTARSDGQFCKCGKQAPIGQSKGWYANHLLDALREAGYSPMRVPAVVAVEGNQP